MVTRPFSFAIPLLAACVMSSSCGEPMLDEALAVDEAARTPRTIDARRSLIITDRAVLDAAGAGRLGASRFSLRRVLRTLVEQSGDPALDETLLFRQLWDTQNPAPGLTGRGPHCDDATLPLHGFPYACRTAEGKQARADADALIDDYHPIALVNRFDLATTDGLSCGEYRIIYAKGGLAPGRNFIIFEPALENPHPEQGLEGCRPLQETWAELSSPEMTPDERAAALDTVYFAGLGDFAPVIRIEAFASEHGQIRTNQFMERPWSLRELKLVHTCGGGACELLFQPVSVKANPFGSLFAIETPAGISFRSSFLDNIDRLAADTVAGISYADDGDAYNAAESTDNADADYNQWFTKESCGFHGAVSARLQQIGSSLTPRDIVRRAHTQSCIGCHQRSNLADLGGGLQWPRSLGFVHVSETTEAGPEGDRYRISSALTDVLLPARQDIVETFLRSGGEAVRARARRLAGGAAVRLSGRIGH